MTESLLYKQLIIVFGRKLYIAEMVKESIYKGGNYGEENNSERSYDASVYRHSY